MTMNMYMIYDNAAEEAGPVFEAKNDTIAIRNYTKLLKDTEFADDFELYRVGYVDRTTMEVAPLQPTKIDFAEPEENTEETPF